MTAPDAGFADLGLDDRLVQALVVLGYEEPTPVQRATIPPLLEGRDLLGQAATGTGKTAAFALPLLQRIAVGKRGRLPVALVLAPTRELAMQVSEAVHRYGRQLGVRVLPVYGGQPIGRQLTALQRGVDVVVATPGRAVDHLQRGTLRLDELQVLVLDEADEMLDMGFAEDLDAVLAAAPQDRQTVLFSATLPSRIDRIARRHLRDPVRVQVEPETFGAGEAPRIRQVAYVVPRAHKPTALARVLDVEQPEATLVFCRTREEVDSLTETLNGRGYRADALHGGMSQEQRDRVMGRLRSGTSELLIATDVAARGLDVEHLTHVVNYALPSATESYVHRIGRVGRAGREGTAITLTEPREQRMLKTIERVTGSKILLQPLPSVADLRTHRLGLTRTALLEALAEGDLELFRPVLHELGSDHDISDIALAAVKLAHLAGGGGQHEQEIPTAPVAPAIERIERPRPSGQAGHAGPSARPSRPGMTKLFVGLGSAAGVRPQDLVGAIAGESSLSGRDVGAIDVSERFSLVEVPEESAEEVIAGLRQTLIRGRKVTVRRERYTVGTPRTPSRGRSS